MRQKKLESTNASQSLQETEQNNNCSELENGSSVNNQAASNDFIPFVDHNSQVRQTL